MSFFVTKFALTDGIREAPEDAEIVQDKYLRFRGGPHHYEFLSSAYFHTDPGEAVAAAKEMRDKKIVSLKKQIKRLEALTFNIYAIKKWGEK